MRQFCQEINAPKEEIALPDLAFDCEQNILFTKLSCQYNSKGTALWGFTCFQSIYWFPQNHFTVRHKKTNDRRFLHCFTWPGSFYKSIGFFRIISQWGILRQMTVDFCVVLHDLVLSTNALISSKLFQSGVTKTNDGRFLSCFTSPGAFNKCIDFPKIISQWGILRQITGHFSIVLHLVLSTNALISSESFLSEAF